MSPVTIAVIGAGSRGLTAYAPYALKHPDRCRIVAVAEPRAAFRQEAATLHGIAPGMCFGNWQEFVRQPRMADAVIIATPDMEHCAPALACMELGYDVLLEKPMAPTVGECRRIAECAEKHKTIFAVCHVLRYTPYFQMLRKLINSGVIGEVMTIRHLEQVCYWHQAHSFVRGNWSNTATAAPMILAKCCHDTDILCFLLGDRKCDKVSSFGSLRHFRPANKPAAATERCLDCPLKDSCIYSAVKFYFDWLKTGTTNWPLNIVTPFNYTAEGLTEALRNGPYGRCVYACDNDVVDQQMVNFEFSGGVTASLLMTAFTDVQGRQTEIHGTHGEIIGESGKITVTRFGEGTKKIYEQTSFGSGMILDGHGGGDGGIIGSFVEAVATRNPECLQSGAATAYNSHMMAFAAEESRVSGHTVDMTLL